VTLPLGTMALVQRSPAKETKKNFSFSKESRRVKIPNWRQLSSNIHRNSFSEFKNNVIDQKKNRKAQPPSSKVNDVCTLPKIRCPCLLEQQIIFSDFKKLELVQNSHMLHEITPELIIFLDDDEDEHDGVNCVATSSAKNVLIENCRSLFLDSVDICETSLDFISIFYKA
jgi:hypothetical protein